MTSTTTKLGFSLPAISHLVPWKVSWWQAQLQKVAVNLLPEKYKKIAEVPGVARGILETLKKRSNLILKKNSIFLVICLYLSLSWISSWKSRILIIHVLILTIKNPEYTCPYPDNQESWIYLSLSWQSRILNIPVLILTIKNPKYTCPHPDNQES